MFGQIASKKYSLPTAEINKSWFQEWRIRIDNDKFIITSFFKRLHDYHRNTEPITVFNENTDWHRDIKYLRAIFDSESM